MVKAGFQKDGGWVGKKMTDEPHAKFAYGAKGSAKSRALAMKKSDNVFNKRFDKIRTQQVV